MEIVELAGADWRPWEPPLWLIALLLCATLIVTFARAADVQDPRIAHQPKPTPCVPQAVQLATGFGYAWTSCR